MTQPEHNLPKKLSAPAIRALVGAGYLRLEQLHQVNKSDLLKLHGFGNKGLRILQEALAEVGLSLADS